MKADSYLLSCAYKYLSINEGRAVPFEELCLFLYTLENQTAFSFEIFKAEKNYPIRVRDLLTFLSDINLIVLDPATDQSSLNLSHRN